MTWALRSERGMTVVETLVSLVVMGAVLPGIVGFLSSTVKWNSEVQEDSTLQTEVRSAADRMDTELRQAYTGDGTAVIESLSSTQITFDTPDRQTPFHLQRVSYRVSGSNLERAVQTSTNTDGPPWTIPAGLGTWYRVMSSIENTTGFTYFDANGAATTTPSAVRTVTITISVGTTTVRGRHLVYTTSVALRNAQ